MRKRPTKKPPSTDPNKAAKALVDQLIAETGEVEPIAHSNVAAHDVQAANRGRLVVRVSPTFCQKIPRKIFQKKIRNRFPPPFADMSRRTNVQGELWGLNGTSGPWGFWFGGLVMGLVGPAAFISVAGPRSASSADPQLCRIPRLPLHTAVYTQFHPRLTVCARIPLPPLQLPLR